MKTTIVAPSLLAADFSETGKALKRIEDSGAAWVHLDVMDGVFVPNLTFGAKMVADLRRRSSLVFDAHLMTSAPEALVDGFIAAGADAITFHIEACVHAHRLVDSIHDAKRKAGISLVPSTPVSVILEVSRQVDMVLVMTVNPGFGGQRLIPRCIDKIAEIAEFRQREGLKFDIVVDGGINTTTAPAVLSAGADVLVMGSAFFESDDPAALVKRVSSMPRRGSSGAL
ncbi:ribulose-phosphate 3-epimerase [Spirochaetota bacterium]